MSNIGNGKNTSLIKRAKMLILVGQSAVCFETIVMEVLGYTTNEKRPKVFFEKNQLDSYTHKYCSGKADF